MNMTKAIIVSAALAFGVGAQAAGGPYDIEVRGLPGLALNQGSTVWQPQPTYPKLALRRGVSGQVLATYDINAQGQAENIRIVESRPRGFFDSSTVRILESTSFARGYNAGVPATLTGKSKRFVYQIVRDETDGQQLVVSAY